MMNMSRNIGHFTATDGDRSYRVNIWQQVIDIGRGIEKLEMGGVKSMTIEAGPDMTKEVVYKSKGRYTLLDGIHEIELVSDDPNAP